MINSDFGKRRVVIYARVSTEHEAQISALENQLDWYEPILAARPEWELVGRYIDEGITGTSAEKRPQFMKMIRDAKQKKFDMIITREVSRFARNTVDTLQYTRDLKAKGVDEENYIMHVSHADAIADAEYVVGLLKEAFPKMEIQILDLSPAFVTQGGPKCVAVQYCIR